MRGSNTQGPIAKFLPPDTEPRLGGSAYSHHPLRLIAYDYVTKPYSPVQLLRVVRGFLDEKV